MKAGPIDIEDNSYFGIKTGSHSESKKEEDSDDGLTTAILVAAGAATVIGVASYLILRSRQWFI